ncbi:MAG: FAD-dependent oxidoreductase, partial [Pseudomonadota bacterium]
VALDQAAHQGVRLDGHVPDLAGRNGGQLAVGPRADIDDYERLVGAADARKVWDMSVEANALVRRLIERHSIDCALAPGVLEVAWRPAHAAEFADYAAHLAERYGYTATEVLDRAATRDRLPTERYHGGLLWREAGHLHPLNYALGLARAASGAGAVLYERTRVTAVRPGRVETISDEGTGTVTAPQVIL